jgi:serine/threonine-protein kinase RsbW
MSNLKTDRLQLRGDLSELSRLAAWIEARAPHQLSTNASFAVQLCLEEAVANIIMHSGTKNDGLEITIELEGNSERLVARIEDNGGKFDPTQFPYRSVANSLKEAKVGQVGIHLIRSFADGMHYGRRDGRNQLTLRFVEQH